MMRWNNTKTYTEDDIMRMQQEAVSRVHEFQNRAQSFYDIPESAITQYDSGGAALYSQQGAPVIEAQSREIDQTPQETPSPMEEKMEEEAGQPQPSMFTQNQQPEMQGMGQPMPDSMNMPAPPPPPVQQAPPKPTDAIRGLLEHFNLDSETLLILGLMFLLYNEKADNVLLMALGYLLL